MSKIHENIVSIELCIFQIVNRTKFTTPNYFYN